MKVTYMLIFILPLFLSCSKQVNNKETVNKDSRAAITTSSLASSITATSATYFDSLFTRYTAGQWTGGDVAYSHLLPDGRSMWLWGDSFVDTVYADRHRPYDAFIHNSIVLTNPQGLFTTLYNGTKKLPKPYFNGKDPYYYWPNCAFLAKGETQAYTMLTQVKATGQGGTFGFTVTGNAFGIIALPGMKLQKITVMPTNTKVDWASATYEEGDYAYIYGAEGTTTFPNTKYMHVMRTSRSRPFAKTEFYTGTGWSTDTAKSARMLDGVSESYSVFKSGSKYYVLSQEGILLSSKIYLWDAASSVGPFTNKRLLYTTPQTKGNIITYNATAHTEFTNASGDLLVGYCINSLNGKDIYTNADNYRPYFVWVHGWQ